MQFEGNTHEKAMLTNTHTRVKVHLQGHGTPANRYSIPNDMTVQVLHNIYGHPSNAILEELFKQGSLAGADVNIEDIRKFECPHCSQHTKRSHIGRRSLRKLIQRTNESKYGDLCLDIKGPLPESTFGKYKYFLVFLGP